MVITIDEFPYLVDQDSALPSAIQRFRDSGAGRAGNLTIIPCGSAVAQMEELLAKKIPLYGRMTLRLEVRQLPLRDLTDFFSRIRGRAAHRDLRHFWGVPYYLTLCDPNAGPRENIFSVRREPFHVFGFLPQ